MKRVNVQKVHFCVFEWSKYSETLEVDFAESQLLHLNDFSCQTRKNIEILKKIRFVSIDDEFHCRELNKIDALP